MSTGTTLPEQKNAEAVQKAQNKSKDVIEFSTGAKIKVKEQMNPSVFIDILADLEAVRPDPPTTYVEAIDREEVNLEDPEYLKNLGRWEIVGSRRMVDALILIGTEFLSAPKGLASPEDNDWIGVLEVLGFKLNRRSKASRYLAWVKHVAIKTADDWAVITENVGRRAGVSESDVQRTQSSFQDKSGKD